ncbi:MAG: branched-chain amino acid ABC transporter ATP-binding protein/permease [Rhodospirillales bacterium]|nr:branched-chain amino acid ABC transporter ATP-binding protein/permease [Rhodospirillales bacterium]
MQPVVGLALLYAAYASAWNIVAGFAGQFTFGHAAFFGLGSYGATLLTENLGVPPLYGLWVGVVLAGIAAAGIGGITLQLRGLYFGLVTAVFPIVFAVVATYMGLQEEQVPFNPNGNFAFFSPRSPWVLSAFALGATLLVGAAAVALMRSRYGLFIGALRADQDAAEASGVRTTEVKIGALVVSAGLAAAIGGIYASVALVVTPGDVFGVQMSVKPVLFSVFGGIGTLLGPIVGALVLVPLSEILTANFGGTLPSLSGLVYGAALLVVITLFPAGLVPVMRDSVFRRLSRGEAAPSPVVEAAPFEPLAPVSTDASPPDETAPAVLEIKGVHKSFGGTRVLSNVHLRLRRGEILGVIGPNGAGKTTLFNVINGFLRPDAGTIELSGRNVTRVRPSTIARAGLGRTFQTARLFSGMSVVENVYAAALTRAASREATRVAWSMLAEVGLSARATVHADVLSTGEIRRLELARAMASAGEGGVLMLDEFLGGLTSADSAVLLASLRRWRARGGSVLAIEHTMRAMADFVDRFVVLNFGEVIADGRPDEIWQDRAVVKAYLGEKWVA